MTFIEINRVLHIDGGAWYDVNFKCVKFDFKKESFLAIRFLIFVSVLKFNLVKFRFFFHSHKNMNKLIKLF